MSLALRDMWSGTGAQQIWTAPEPRPLALSLEPIDVTRSVGTWFRDAARRLNFLRSLPRGWDGYHAKPVSTAVDVFTRHVLSAVALPGIPVPSIVPLSYGGIQLEWHRNGWDIEIEITGPNHIQAWKRDLATDSETEIELTTDLAPLNPFIAPIRD